MPVKNVWDRNIAYWEKFLQKVIPEITTVYGTDSDYAFEERGVLFLPRGENPKNIEAIKITGIYNSTEEMNRSPKQRKRLQLAGAAIVTIPLIFSAACDYLQPDKNGPVIQMYARHSDILVENENINLSITTLDDSKVKEVYIIIDNKDKIPFKEVSKKRSWTAPL